MSFPGLVLNPYTLNPKPFSGPVASRDYLQALRRLASYKGSEAEALKG